MKSIQGRGSRFSRSVIAVLFAVCLGITGCDNEGDNNIDNKMQGELLGDMNGAIDGDFINTLVVGQNVLFSKKQSEIYDKDGLSGWEWELRSEVYAGANTGLPDAIVFVNGECCVPFQLWRCSGPHPLALAWNAYQTVKGKSIGLLLGREFKLTGDDSRNFMIGDRTYVIECMSHNKFTLSYQSTFSGGRTGNGGETLELARYVENAKAFDQNENVLVFKSERELCIHVIALLREQFGEEINLNDIYSPEIIYDEPIIRISELEHQLGLL